jgi:hypothetical protein
MLKLDGKLPVVALGLSILAGGVAWGQLSQRAASVETKVTVLEGKLAEAAAAAKAETKELNTSLKDIAVLLGRIDQRLLNLEGRRDVR